MINTEFENLYPRRFMSQGAMESTTSTTLSSGTLTVGNTYFISATGGSSTSFAGAITNAMGEFFVATGTSATFDGATLEDISSGKPTKIGFFYGHPLTLEFIWKLTYNDDDDCTSLTVANPDGTQIDR